MKGKFKPRLGMLRDQQGSTVFAQEKIKVRWKQYTERLYRSDNRMTDIFEEDSHDEKPACKVKVTQ